MATSIKTLIPGLATHPGEVLIDELNERKIKQSDFAKMIDIPATQLNEMIKGKRNFNADFCLRIAKVLNMDEKYWMNLQSNYDLDLAKKEEKNIQLFKAHDSWKMIKDFIPFAFFSKLKIITHNPIEDVATILNIYSVSNIDEFKNVFTKPNYCKLRKSEKLDVNKINLIGWLNYIYYQAKQIKVPSFEIHKKEELIVELKAIFKNNQNTIALTKEVLAKYGIKLIVLNKPEKCAVDGVSFWSDENPAIGLSIRHKTIDNFAFTVLHEVGHIFTHLINNKTAEFIDLELDSKNDFTYEIEEQEADFFAQESLISTTDWNTFKDNINIHNENEVKNYANTYNVHPATITGRYAKETNNYKIKCSDKVLK